MEAIQTFKKIYKIPFIGDLIISFAIIVVLTTLSSAGGYFGLEGAEKALLINIYIGCGIVAFVISLFYKSYHFLKIKK